MKKILYGISAIFLVMLLCYGCNIVPKSVQYQKEEEKLIGSTEIVNPTLEQIQVVLKNEGYETGNTDGKMGKETRDAIRAFQESIGLKSTGYIDKMTLTQIEDLRRTKEALEPKKDYRVKVKGAGSETKVASSKGFTPTTKEIQSALKKAGFDPGPIDGKMGSKTRQAIKDFQKAKGLVADGVVGPKTWTQLSKYL